MKLFSLIPLLSLTAFTLLVCQCGTRSKSGIATAYAAERKGETKSEDVERYYFVRGMSCGGCKIGVTSTLKDSSLNISEIVEVDNNTPDPENKIGHAIVKFSKGNYRGQETDCKIAKKIKDDLGYAAYWDKADTNPCKL